MIQIQFLKSALHAFDFIKNKTVLAFTVLALTAAPAAAQDMGDGPFPPPAPIGSNMLTSPEDMDPDFMEQLPDEPTHPSLRLTVDKSEILSFDRDIGRIIIPHETHISILPDSNRRVVIVPYAIGTTFFRILDENGEILMQRHAIVGAPKQNYVRIRRSCSDAVIGCVPTTVYYCEDMCHEMALQERTGEVDTTTGQVADPNAAQNQQAATQGTQTGLSQTLSTIGGAATALIP